MRKWKKNPCTTRNGKRQETKERSLERSQEMLTWKIDNLTSPRINSTQEKKKKKRSRRACEPVDWAEPRLQTGRGLGRARVCARTMLVHADAESFLVLFFCLHSLSLFLFFLSLSLSLSLLLLLAIRRPVRYAPWRGWSASSRSDPSRQRALRSELMSRRRHLHGAERACVCGVRCGSL